MPATIQAYTKKTLSKALSWLEQQPKDGATATDTINADTAVCLYLKAQNEEKERKNKLFVKELKKYCTNNTTVAEESLKDPSHPKDHSTTNEDPLIKEDHSTTNEDPLIKEDFPEQDNSSPLAKPLNLNEEIDFSVLDLKSKDLIEKTRKGLNLSNSEESLRILIQIGYKSLKPLLNS